MNTLQNSKHRALNFASSLLTLALVSLSAGCETTSSSSPIIIDAIARTADGQLVGVARTNLRQHVVVGAGMLQLRVLETTTGLPLWTLTSQFAVGEVLPAEYRPLFPDAEALGITFDDE